LKGFSRVFLENQGLQQHDRHACGSKEPWLANARHSPRLAALWPAGCGSGHRFTRHIAVKDIIIVGAGGLGREVLQYVLESVDLRTHRIKGFLDDFRVQLEPESLGFSVLGTTAGYQPAPDDRFVLAVGEPRQRMILGERLTGNGAHFLTVIHPLAHVAKTAELGAGCIVAPFVTIGACATLGNHVSITYYASIGHDAKVGDYCSLSPYSAANGGTVLEACVFLGTHAAVNPLKRVGHGSKVAAGAVVYHDVPPDSLAAGNPARCIPLMKTVDPLHGRDPDE
jgi:sugar O-acyltransferase (sialic acid O-acetyltransferase NeuD family)